MSVLALVLVILFADVSAFRLINPKAPGAPVELPYRKWKSEKVLFISAHPDDIEACAGGLIWQLTLQGTEVHYLILTNGDKGCGNPFCMNWTSPQIASTRLTEAANAGLSLGVKPANIHVLGYGDAMLTSYPEAEVRQVIIRHIRQIKPQVIMTWHLYPDLSLLPSAGWDDLGFHPDHQQAGRLALASNFDAGVRLLFQNEGPEWHARDFFLFTFSSATHYFDISQPPFMDQKVSAYLEHKTQYPNATIVDTSMRFLGQAVTAELGLPSPIVYAEGFTQYS